MRERSARMVVSGEPEAPRAALITRLVERHDLVGVARAAAEAAGIADRVPAVTYCLCVLAQKVPTAAERGLVLGHPDFDRRLREQAHVVAGCLRDWAGTYQAIQDEGDRHELTTLRRYVSTRLGDDVVDTTADRVGVILAAGVPIEDMSLGLAYDEEPAGSEYVFQSPLGPWIRLSAKRMFPRETDPLSPDLTTSAPSLDEHIERDACIDEDTLRALAASVAAELDTRDLLESLIERAEAFDAELLRMRPASPTHSALLVRLRATINDLADQLRRERRALRDLLAYIVLAFGRARQMQAATILSLRTTAVDRAAAESIAARMRAMLRDADQPTPALVARTRNAASRGVPTARGTTLVRLRERPDDRVAELAGVAQLLDDLPLTVGSIVEIGEAMPQRCSAHTVAQYRYIAGEEFAAVDPWMDRAYARYAVVD
jgi:hypothetical protein